MIKTKTFPFGCHGIDALSDRAARRVTAKAEIKDGLMSTQRGHKSDSSPDGALLCDFMHELVLCSVWIRPCMHASSKKTLLINCV